MIYNQFLILEETSTYDRKEEEWREYRKIRYRAVFLSWGSGPAPPNAETWKREGGALGWKI